MDHHQETQDMLAASLLALLERKHSTEALCRGEATTDLWDALVELGLTAAESSEEAGGFGLPFAHLAPLFQIFGQRLATTYFLEFSIVGGWLASACGASAMSASVQDGSSRIALASGEPGAGGDLAFTRTTAERSEAGWNLNGTKSVIVGGDRATHFLIPALLDGSELGLFLVEATQAGVERHSFALYDGSYAADLTLENASVAQEALLTRGEEAQRLIELALDRGRAALCHEAVGLMEALLDVTLEYVKTRKQFDRPIGSFQTMQHRLADGFMDVELVRSAAELASDAVRLNLAPEQRLQAISAAKYTAATCARRAGQSAVQAHGGIALTREYVAGHYFKRLTMIERYLGTAADHLERYIQVANAPKTALLQPS